MIDKLDSIPIDVVELSLYHENDATVGYPPSAAHTNTSVAFSTIRRGSEFVILTVGES
jgi:hypothetical protein